MGAWQMDQMTLVIGRQVEKDINDGKPLDGTAKPDERQWVDLRKLKKPKLVKVKENGTW